MCCREYGLRIQTMYSTFSDQELDNVVRPITTNQRIGPNAMQGRLIALGHRVQRYRVRESMLRVAPEGAAIRAAPTVQRRTYSVAGPNSLWHIDGNHKLIRYMIH